jgi:two-component system nitrogen regulation sensor histidine kinase NtrY
MAPILKHLWSRYTSRTRRYVLIVFFVFVAIALVELIAYFLAHRIDTNWDEISESRTREVVDGAVRAFSNVQRHTHDLARTVAQNVELISLVEKENPNRTEIFSLIDQLNTNQHYSLELCDSKLSLLAWSGQQAESDSMAVRRALTGKPLSSISQSALYTILNVLVPIASDSGKVLGVVVASRPVEVNYPLNNRFLSSSGLQKALSERFGTAVRFEFGESAEPSTDAQVVSEKLVGIDGQKLGMVFVDRPSRDSYTQGYERIFKGALGSLVGVVPIILFFGVWPNVRRFRAVAQFLIFFLFAWAARYLWLAVGFPGLLFSGGLFDPAYFASPFAFGATRSIGEVLISSLFVFATATFGLALLVKHSSAIEWRSAKVATVVGGLIIIVLGVGLPYLARGYSEALRSAVFDSKLRYTDPTAILPDALVGVMLVALLLLSISFLFIQVALFLFAVQLRRPAFGSSPRRGVAWWLSLVVLFALESLLFGLLHPNPQSSFLYRLLLIGLVALLTFFLQREARSAGKPFTGRSLVLATGLSIIIAAPMFDAKVHEHDRQVLQLYAAELTRPVDNWIRLTLQETVGQIESDEEVVSALTSQDRDVISGLAFRLWAESKLSSEGFNCAVGIVQRGTLQSLFNLGLQRYEASRLVLNVGEFPERRIFVVRSGKKLRGLDRYVGTTPIRSTDGDVLANAVVIVVAGQGTLLRTETPEILQTPSALMLETEFRNLVVSEFVNRRLVQTTGEDVGKDSEVPEEIDSVLASGESAYVWVDEAVDGKGYETLYTLQQNDAGGRRILALSMGSLDFRWHIFNLLKIVFLYIIIGAFIVGVYALFLGLRRRSLRLSFRGKLLVALLSLATIPMLLLSYYDRQFTDESRIEILRRQAQDELKVVGANLLSHLGRSPSAFLASSLTDSLCERIAQETGSDFNVYVGAFVQASSRPELYDAELVDTRMSSAAYTAIVLEGKRFFLQPQAIGKYPFLAGYERFDDEFGHPLGVLSAFTAFKHQAVDEELFKRSALILGTYAGLMVLVVIIGVFFAYRIASPIRKLSDGIRRVSRGDLNLALEVQSRDELGELVAAFNRMTQDLKRIQRELASAERELAWREMAKQVAHEIKNPLTPMKLSIQHLRQAYADRVQDFHLLLEEVSQTIIEQVESLSRIAAEFSRYAKMPERKLEPCLVHDLLLDAVRLFAQEKKVQFKVDLAEGKATILADKEELRRVFINVLRNAVQAITGEGEIRVTTRLTDGQIEIAIADTGRGIPAELKERLFEPNFSTKSEGMGLGLAISKQTVVDLNGRIEIESVVGKGTQVKITLPADASS